MPKVKVEKIDGLNPDEIEKVRKAIRQVWNWSYSRRLAKKRATNEDGFQICEATYHKGDRVVPKIQVHHLKTVGDVDSGFLERLFCPSKDLLCLCLKCHNLVTKEERKTKKGKRK